VIEEGTMSNARQGKYNVWDIKKQKYVTRIGAISKARWIVGPGNAGSGARNRPDFDRRVSK